MFRTSEGWINQYQNMGALWVHDGNPKRPHALLTSGKHSNGYFNSGLVTEDPFLLDEACSDLVQLLKSQNIFKHVDRVVGPAMGAITLAHDIARHVAFKRSRPCFSAYTEKEKQGDNTLMVFKRTAIYPGEHILLAEDVLTTGGSVELTVTAVINNGGVVLPIVAVLVNRTGLKEINGRKIVALIDRAMPMWLAGQCPLCKEGSIAIRPKDVSNWERLNATY